MNLSSQILSLLVMIASGLILGILFDIYRVVASQLHFRRWLIALLDMVYWIIATVFVFLMLYLSNSGEARLYVFLGLFMGTIIHYVYFSQLTIKMVLKWIRWTKKLIHFLVRLYHVLIITPLMFIYRSARILLRIMVAASILVCKFMVQLLYPIWRIIKWLLITVIILKWLQPIMRKIFKR